MISLRAEICIESFPDCFLPLFHISRNCPLRWNITELTDLGIIALLARSLPRQRTLRTLATTLRRCHHTQLPHILFYGLQDPRESDQKFRAQLSR